MSSSSVHNGQSPGLWSLLAPYVAPPIAASVAIVPFFYGFMAKSALQLGEPVPKFKFRPVLQQSLKAGPTIGLLVGSQIVTQNIFEWGWCRWVSPQQDKNNFTFPLACTVIVAFITSAGSAVFNGQTMGRTPLESLRGLSLKQTAAVVGRETCFLFSIRISDPVTERAKKRFGNSKLVEYGTPFLAGVAGSLAGHPADTAFTLWQKGRQIIFSQLMRGAGPRAFAVGGFSCAYHSVKKLFNTE